MRGERPFFPLFPFIAFHNAERAARERIRCDSRVARVMARMGTSAWFLLCAGLCLVTTAMRVLDRIFSDGFEHSTVCATNAVGMQMA